MCSGGSLRRQVHTIFIMLSDSADGSKGSTATVLTAIMQEEAQLPTEEQLTLHILGFGPGLDQHFIEQLANIGNGSFLHLPDRQRHGPCQSCEGLHTSGVSVCCEGLSHAGDSGWFSCWLPVRIQCLYMLSYRVLKLCLTKCEPQY